MYSIALGPRFLWKMLNLSGPNALLFLQLLIALATMFAVKVSAISIGFLLVSLVTNRVSLEEECLPNFEVLNCLLNLAASCLDDENEIPLKEIASFSAVNSFDSSPQLSNICLMVQVLNKISPFFRVCSQMRFWMSLFSLGSSGEVRSPLRRTSRLVITSSISAGTGSLWSLCRPLGMWCDAALSRNCCS